jgi:hypothetical protein
MEGEGRTFSTGERAVTWAANNGFAMRSTIESVWSQTRRDFSRPRRVWVTFR